MNYVYLVILLALLQFIYFSARTGMAREKYGVNAPKTVGHETWERIYRVQQNTMEQLVIFIPGMLAFAYFVSPRWALVPGVLYLIGRQLYSYMYITDPKTRAPGVALSFFSNIALTIGALVGLVMRMGS
jgi:uncharacterized MAPEG superfamily protein